MIKKLVYKTVLAMFLATPLFSQTEASKGDYQIFSLDKAIEVALTNNYDGKLADAQAVNAKMELKGAFGTYLPGMNFNMGYSRNLNPKDNSSSSSLDSLAPYLKNYYSATSPNSYNMSLMMNYNIFDGFNREENYSRVQNSMKAAEFNIRQTRQNIVIDVYRKYIQMIRNSQIMKIRKENLEMGKSELKRIQAQYEAGAIPVAIVYAQEADLGNKEVDLITSENDMNIVKAQLLTIMGLNPDMTAEFELNGIPADVADDAIANYKAKIGPMNTSIKSALNSRFDYSMNKIYLENSNKTKNMAEAAYFPSLSASGGWAWNNTKFSEFSDKGTWTAGLNLSVPLFNGYQTEVQVQNAELQVQQRRFELARLEQNIRISIQTAYLNLDATEKQFEISKKSVKASEQNFKSMKERLAVGSSSITDYITANTQYITSQINKINAVYNYIQAQKELDYALGKLAY